MDERALLLDGDVFAYQASAVSEHAINWGDEDEDNCLWTLHSYDEEAFDVLDNSIASVVKYVGGDRVIVALTDTKNWRMDVLPTYKSNRAPTRKPLVLPAVRQYLRDHYEVWERPGLEGDDVLGILMTSKKIVKAQEKICVSIDKDMRTVPGLHFNSGKRHEGIFEVSTKEAERFHLYQTLMGDQVDGYTGCPGVGPKAAAEFLNDPYVLTPEPYVIRKGKRKGEEGTKWVKKSTDNVWAGIVSLFAKAGYSEEYALQQARVARILRAQDYDFKRKEPILWTP